MNFSKAILISKGERLQGRPMRNWLATLAAVLLLLPCNARSATFTVPVDFSTVQAAIDGVADGDTIIISRQPDGAYRENLSIVNKTIHLRPIESRYITTIFGQDLKTVLTITGSGLNGPSEIVGLTLTHGVGFGGGIRIENSSPIIRDCDIQDNVGAPDGGPAGVAVLGGSPKFIGSTIHDNQYVSADERGTAMYVDENSVVDLIRCRVTRNSGPTGSGIYVNGGVLNVIGSMIYRNETTGSTGEAGGIYNQGGTVNLINSVVVANTASRGGNYGGGNLFVSYFSSKK